MLVKVKINLLKRNVRTDNDEINDKQRKDLNDRTISNRFLNLTTEKVKTEINYLIYIYLQKKEKQISCN